MDAVYYIYNLDIMTTPLTNGNEKERLDSLRKHEILDTPPERAYDDITWLTAKACGAPIATISFFDKNRVWFKSKIGMDLTEIDRVDSLCEYALMDREDFVVVPDAILDPRFAGNRNVMGGLGIRFYASALLVTPDNYVLGALSIADTEPRTVTDGVVEVLRAFAGQVSQTLALRLKTIELQRANAELKDLSLRDELTGLYNRRGLQTVGEQYLKQMRTRESATGAWVLVADLDGLKKINDRFGHHEGSSAIEQSALLLASCFRGSDILARTGGDEFVAFMVNTHNIPPSTVAARIQEAFDRYNAASKKTYRLSVSVGIVRTDHADKRSLSDLIQAADEGMYKAKQKNRLKNIPGFESTHIHQSIDPFMISSEKLHTSGDPRHVS